jgi:DNA polymerase III delta prime subunit
MKAIIGHEKKWRALSRAFSRGITPQTLLISGPARVGKSTLITRYAQLLLCQDVAEVGGVAQPCGVCRICRQVESETFPDFRVTRPAVMSAEKENDRIVAPEEMESSIINKAQAREFGAEAMMRPQVGARKVMLIQQADHMENDAQSVLLKTWEEPINGLTIILLVENPDKLLPTVRSRCWHLRLGLAPAADIEAWLQTRASTRGLNVSPEVVRDAVLLAAGRPGAAWREIERAHRAALEGEAALATRFAQTSALVERMRRSQSFASLSFTEAAQSLAQKWWDEDRALDAEAARGSGKNDAKKSANKETRSALARFLDELSGVYRARWLESLRAASTREETQAWARGLDLIRKTRHYILRNANAALALDVMFASLQSLQAPKAREVASATTAPRR